MLQTSRKHQITDQIKDIVKELEEELDIKLEDNLYISLVMTYTDIQYNEEKSHDDIASFVK